MNSIDYNKVQETYRQRSQLHGNHSVLTGSADAKALHADALLDYITRKRLLKHLKPQKTDSILDFGCGVGRLSFMLAPKCATLTGIDASKELIETAIERNRFANTSFVHTGFGFHPLPYTLLFNKVFTVGVLYHIPDDDLAKTLNDFSKKLKPGGKFVFIEHISPGNRILYNVGIQRNYDTWKQLLENNGFCIEKITKIMRVPSYSMSLWKKTPRLFSFMMPLFYWLENCTVNRKPHLAEYYYCVFECRPA